MGDRAWVGFTVYAVADRDVRALFDWMEDQTLIGYGEQEILLGQQYEVEEMTLGWCSDEVTRLVEKAPSVVVDASQGNRYEFNGEQLYYTPTGGLFLGEADGSGSVVLTEDDIDKAFRDLPRSAQAGALYGVLMAKLGVPQREAVFRVASPLLRKPGEDWKAWSTRLPVLRRPPEEEEGTYTVIGYYAEDGSVQVTGVIEGEHPVVGGEGEFRQPWATFVKADSPGAAEAAARTEMAEANGES